MKIGTITRSMSKPTEGFTFRREGYEIYISYIEPNSIKEIETDDLKEYEYMQYNYYGAISTYEELVNKSVLLKYSIEEELSLMAKAIIDQKEPKYIAYRNFVELCKSSCKDNYIILGLTKNDN